MEPTHNKTAQALRALTEKASDGSPLNLTEAEKVVVAAELYRLADAILGSPTTARDLDSVQQAQRRAAWLMRWLERAMIPPIKDDDMPHKP
jgi:hypothetical protein